MQEQCKKLRCIDSCCCTATAPAATRHKPSKPRLAVNGGSRKAQPAIVCARLSVSRLQATTCTCNCCSYAFSFAHALHGGFAPYKMSLGGLAIARTCCETICPQDVLPAGSCRPIPLRLLHPPVQPTGPCARRAGAEQQQNMRQVMDMTTNCCPSCPPSDQLVLGPT